MISIFFSLHQAVHCRLFKKCDPNTQSWTSPFGFSEKKL
jgi:hypothetical protein